MTDYNRLHKKIAELSIDVLADESLKKHTTFKIGGNAKLFCRVNNNSQLISLIKLLKNNQTKYFVLGNGSNILADDKGFDGVIITLSGDFLELSLLDATTIYAGSAVKLSALCTFAAEHALSGLEFAYGIPGTVGGAVYMNAGAYGGEMKDVLDCVLSIDEHLNSAKTQKSDLDLSYRHSFCSNLPHIITFAVIKLQKGDKKVITSSMNEISERRKDKQPLNFPSAGSVFKRPEGYFAGALIESCNLKGFKIGGAQVSTKHAGFIINSGGATGVDVKNLIKHIQKTVSEEHKVSLECEIKILEF